jgi:putative phosphoserine phosphatase/1-acylglycerol-3-phosphate O-acyltransferase
VVRDGRFTGEAERPVCYGAGKIYWAERFAAAEGIDLDRSYFYTDSITDLPVLERVGEPRVVNPDLRLRRVAARRGWPLLRLSLGETAAAPLARASGCDG